MEGEMNKVFKIVLMVCAVVLVLAVSGSLIYYFGFFKPNNERAEWEAEIKVKEEQLAFEKEKLRKEEEKREEEELKKYLKEKQREIDLQNCLDGAYEDYDKMWAEAVKRLDSKGDALPLDLADSLNEMHTEQREECFKRYGPG